MRRCGQRLSCSRRRHTRNSSCGCPTCGLKTSEAVVVIQLARPSVRSRAPVPAWLLAVGGRGRQAQDVLITGVGAVTRVRCAPPPFARDTCADLAGNLGKINLVWRKYARMCPPHKIIVHVTSPIAPNSSMSCHPATPNSCADLRSRRAHTMTRRYPMVCPTTERARTSEERVRGADHSASLIPQGLAQEHRGEALITAPRDTPKAREGHREYGKRGADHSASLIS